MAHTLAERRTLTPDLVVHSCHHNAVLTRLLRSSHTRPGPGSVSWKINREIVVVAGWGRAILLQLAHPSVAAGVHHHSAFRGSLSSGMGRLRATVGAMLRITFGDTDDMIGAAAAINTVHDRVRGRGDGAGGQVYSAHDPALQQWVHATLLESMPLIYERLVGPLTLEELDRYCAESTIMEPLLGIPEGRLPRTASQLTVYLNEMLTGGTLEVTDTSRALARAVLYPPSWQVAWPAFRAVQLLTIGTLPASIRDAYGFTWSASDDRALARWTRMLRMARRGVPRVAREWPIARRAGVTLG